MAAPRCCTAQSWTSAGRTCWASCGAAGAGRPSQRRASPRGASCRTGHSRSSGGTDRTGCNTLASDISVQGHSHNTIQTSLPPVWVVPCKYRMCRCYCCVGEAADRHWSSAGHHSHGCLGAQGQAFESVIVHRNSKPEKLKSK